MAGRYRVFIDLPPSDLSDLDPRYAEPLWDELQYYEDLRVGVVGSGGLCGGTEALSNRDGTAERDGAYGACCSAPSRVARAAAPESIEEAA